MSADRHRRLFLRYLAASPLCAALSSAERAFANDGQGQRMDDPESVIDVFDLQATARDVMPPAHFGYIETGTFGDTTLRANRTAFDKFYLRSRRLVDVSNIDTRVTLLGEEYASPIVLCPVGSQKAFHADGEMGSARAARRRNHLQILSTVSSTGVEDVHARTRRTGVAAALPDRQLGRGARHSAQGGSGRLPGRRIDR